MGVYVEFKEDLCQIVRGLQSLGKKVVFTNGVFDLIHVGHIRSLIDARSRGDFLVVAVNSDASTKRLKGPGLPVNPLKERIEILLALECIDYVTAFDEDSAGDLLSLLRPDIHAKGSDYTKDTVPEREIVTGYGGEIAIVGDPKDHFTTHTLKKIARIFSGKKSDSLKAAGKSGSRKSDSGSKTNLKKKTAKKATKSKAKPAAKTTAGKKKVTRKKQAPKKKAAKKTTPKKAGKTSTKAKKSGSKSAKKKPAKASAPSAGNRSRAVTKKGRKKSGGSREMKAY